MLCKGLDNSNVPVVGSIAPQRCIECSEGVLEQVCACCGCVRCVIAKMRWRR